MNPNSRVGLFILLLGIGVITGTLFESAIPLNVVNEQAVFIEGFAEETIFGKQLLFSRNFRLMVQVGEGGPVECVLFQLGGSLRWSGETSNTFLVYDALPIRGLFNFTIRNLNESLASLRIVLDQFGDDREQLGLGIVFFIIGIVFFGFWEVKASRNESPSDLNED